MFVFMESVLSAIASITSNRLRSFLTTLGIIVGVASIIATVSIIQGLNQSITSQFAGLGSNSLVVTSFTPFEEGLKGNVSRLTSDDFDIIRHRAEGIDSITPVLHSQTQLTEQIRFGAQTAFSNIYGTTRTFRDVSLVYIKSGRFISDSDNETRRRVCVIGETVRENLSLPANPVGEFVQINGEWLKVIGLLESKGKLLGYDQDDLALLPYNTMRYLIGNQINPDIRIQLTVKDIDIIDTVARKIEVLLRKSRNIKTGDDDFKVQTPEQLTSTFSDVIRMVTMVMGGIVGISLLVAGIGIMNIMLVSVSERTRESGIWKAIGAKRHHILLQFLIEALVLCILGGIIGVFIGFLIGALVSFLLPGFPPAYVPVWAVFLSIGFSAFVGIIFGILPASKAADMNPIEALRQE